jgi:hypothetical protein
LTHAAQKKWRQEWTLEATDELLNMLQDLGNTVSVRTVQGPLVEFTKQVKAEVGFARVVDARRPKLSVNLSPVTSDQPQEKPSNWTLPGGVLAMSAVIVMTSE